MALMFVAGEGGARWGADRPALSAFAHRRRFDSIKMPMASVTLIPSSVRSEVRPA